MDAYQYVFPLYMKKNRFYHDIRHINKMIEGLYKFRNRINNHLYLAILFHDVVYDVPFDPEFSNEEKSVVIFDNWYDEYGYPFTIDPNHIKSLILSTEHHFDGKYVSHSADHDLMMDLDLLAFADPYPDFVRTQNDIDKEFFPFFEHDVVVQKRTEFLTNILENKTLKYHAIDTIGILTNMAYNNIEQYLKEQKRNI